MGFHRWWLPSASPLSDPPRWSTPSARAVFASRDPPWHCRCPIRRLRDPIHLRQALFLRGVKRIASAGRCFCARRWCFSRSGPRLREDATVITIRVRYLCAERSESDHEPLLLRRSMPNTFGAHCFPCSSPATINVGRSPERTRDAIRPDVRPKGRWVTIDQTTSGRLPSFGHGSDDRPE